MKACWAILKDSYREAAASRILWLSLGLILVVLLALAPMGLKSVPSTQIRPFELIDPPGLVSAIAQGANEEGGPAKHVWGLLEKSEQEGLQQWIKDNGPEANAEPAPPEGGRPRRRRQGQILSVINRLLEKPEFYDAAVWTGIELDESLRAADAADISKEDRAVRNVKRFAAAFDDYVDVQDDNSLALSYGTLTMAGPLRIPPIQVGRMIDEIIVSVLSIFLGFFGVFGSLLVTASMIPRTFEPGEIALLLSKPVYRSQIFVTKFLGGCIFTLICASLLVSGTWLLLWTRFDLWRPELLWCIPLYVFLFAIYYSVSALAGAIWRNPVVSLIMVVVFWIMLTTAGSVNDFMVNLYVPGQELKDLSAAGDDVYALDGGRNYLRWDSISGDWTPIMEQQSQNPFQAIEQLLQAGMKPRVVAADNGNTVYSLQPEFSRFGQAATATLIRGDKEGKFERESEAATPEPVFAVFVSGKGELLLPGTRQIFRFEGISEEQKQSQTWLRNIFGGMVPSGSSRAFQGLLNPGTTMNLRPDAAVTMNPANDSVIAWNNGKLETWVRGEDGKYSAGPSKEISKPQGAVIACAGNRILCATADRQILNLDAATLETLSEGKVPEGDKPSSVDLSADGAWGVILTHAGDVLMLDGKAGTFRTVSAPSSGKISAVRFSPQGDLIVASRRSAVFLDPSSDAVRKRKDGTQNWPFVAYDFVVRPLYRVLPKPRELDLAVRYLVTGERTVQINEGANEQQNSVTEDLNQNRIAFDPWSSFLSNMGFIVVMLAVGCLYISRSDF